MARRRILPLALLLATVAACSGGATVESTSADLAETSTTSTAATAPTTTSTLRPQRTPGQQRELDDVVERLLSPDSSYHPDLDEADARCIAEGLTDELGDDMADAIADLAIGEEPDELVRRRDAEAAVTIIEGCTDVRAAFDAAITRDMGVPIPLGPCVSRAVSDDDLRAVLVSDLTPDDVSGLMFQILFEAIDECAGAEADTVIAGSFAAIARDEGIATPAEAACMGERMLRSWRRNPAALGDGFLEFIDALVECVDMKTFLVTALVENGVPRPAAECTIGQLSPADARTFMRAQFDDSLAGELAKVEARLDAARAACGVGA